MDNNMETHPIPTECESTPTAAATVAATEKMPSPTSQLPTELVRNFRRPNSYSSSFKMIYDKINTPQGYVMVRTIQKRDLKVLFEHDFNMPLDMFRSSVRLMLYKYMRQFIRCYQGTWHEDMSGKNMNDFWQHLNQSFKTLGAQSSVTTGEARKKQKAMMDTLDPAGYAARPVNCGGADAGNSNSGEDSDSHVECIDLCGDDDYEAILAAVEAKKAKKATRKRRVVNHRWKNKKGSSKTANLFSRKAASATGGEVQNLNQNGKNLTIILPCETADDRTPDIDDEDTCLNIQTILNSKNQSLKIYCSRQNFYALKISLASANLMRYRFDGTAPLPNVGDRPVLSTMELLHWPSIGIQLKLGDVSCWRCVRPNFRHQIVGGRDPRHDLDTAANDTRLRRLMVASNATDQPQLSTLIFEHFLAMMTECLTMAQLTNTQMTDLRTVLRLILTEISAVPQLHLRQRYAQLKCAHRFFRWFGHADDDSTVLLRESINPETEFCIDACPFVCGVNEEDWSDDLIEYFQRILLHHHKKTLDDLAAMFSSCMEFECTECCVTFVGPSALDAAKDHVHRVHDADNVGSASWQCARCGWHTADGRMCGNWEHCCPTAAAADAS